MKSVGICVFYFFFIFQLFFFFELVPWHSQVGCVYSQRSKIHGETFYFGMR